MIGIGCRFPGARGTDELWQLLLDGAEHIREVPPDRFDIDEFHDSRPQTPGRVATRYGGFLDDIDQFDAAYFRISPREAAQLDPQHRLLLETSAEALHDAGLTRELLAGSRAGAFVGQSSRSYWEHLSGRGILDVYSTLGTMGSGSSGRLSHAFDLRGPSLSIDTACSSSLVAVHQACRSLRGGECEVAIAAGVQLILSAADSIAYSQGSMLAPDGRCKFGAASADGFVRSEGVAAVVLKPYARAVADGDRVHALILGSAAGNDGGSDAGVSMMTPSEKGQVATLRAAYADADVDPAEIGYVEAHGTGTPVGDPVELRAIAEVIGARHSADRPVAVGSIKTNIGHLEAAAGMAGLIKAVLCVRNRYIPASLHADQLTPALDWSTLPVEVARSARPWPTTGRAVVGVSSTGMSGTNAHVVVGEVPAGQVRSMPPADAGTDQARLLTLSARSGKALQELAQSYVEFIEAGTASVPDICHTAGARRDHHEHRLTAVGATSAELVDRLRGFLADTQVRGLAGAAKVRGTAPRVVFVFPGQGSQWVGMARELIRTAPMFAATLAECDAAVRAEAGWSLIERLTTDGELASVDVVQPVLWAIEVALAAQWTAWGVRPDVVVGHSMGEVAAACVAGALSLPDGAAVICRRSALLAKVSGAGAMASVELTIEQAEAEIAPFADRVSVAVSNSAGSTVLAGDPEAVDEILDGLAAREIFGRRVKVDIASHSPQMDVLRDDLLAELDSVRPKAGAVRMVSTVDRADVAGTELTAGYWARNLREPVRFGAVTRQLAEEAPSVFVEISPHPVLVPAIQETLDDVGAGSVVASTRRDEPELATLLHSAGQVHLAGVRLDWSGVNPGNHVALPAYPWQRARHWFADLPTSESTVDTAVETPVSSHPLLRGFSKDTEDRWVGKIDPTANAYLRDHQVQGVPVLPGAAYVELVLAALDSGRGTAELRDFQYHSAIYLDTAPSIRLDITGDRVTVGSRPTGATDWVTNATGTVRFHEEQGPVTASAYLRGVARAHVSGDEFYERFATEGNQWLGAFRGIARLWCGTDEATAHIKAPASIASTVPGHAFHPALLDACFQALLGAIDPDELGHHGSSVVLGGFDSLRVYDSPRDSGLRCRVVRTSSGRPDSFAGDITVLDEDGTVLAEIRGLWSRYLESAVAGAPAAPPVTAAVPVPAVRAAVPVPAVRAAAGGSRVEDLLYEVRWEPAPLPSAAELGRGYWLLFTDAGGVGRDLASRLGPAVATVAKGTGFRALGEGRYEIDPANPADYRAVLAAVNAEFGDLWCRIVHLWSLDTAGPLDTSAGRSVPHLVTALTEPADLWLVTRGAQQLGGDRAVAPAQSLVWGLGRSLAAERPDLRSVLVDLPSDTRTAAELVREVSARDVGENQIAVRATGRHVARLARGVTPPDRLRHRAAEPHDDRTPARSATLEPGPGEVVIDVGHAAVSPGQCDDGRKLGRACAGTIAALGAGVAGLSVGDTVVALASGAMRARVIADARLVFPAPARLTGAESAAALGGHLTAYLGLHELGRLKEGQRVLIHSAAGGVGLAAVQYARTKGAEVYATAGSAQERAMLRMLGVRYVGDSGAAGFADEILAETRGRGVEIVFNTQAEPIEPSLATLAPGGRFVDAARTDPAAGGQVSLASFGGGRTYSALDLPYLVGARQDDTAGAMRHVLALLGSGQLDQVPGDTRQVGEPVPDSAGTRVDHRVEIRPDATYLVTGGLGGLGTYACQWLLDNGARHVLALGRSPSARPLDARIGYQQVDVADEAALRSVLRQREEAGLPPLRGVLHTAGVLEFAAFDEYTPRHLDDILNPKVAGGWALHQATLGLPLDFFVLYSSGTSVFGSAHTSAYAAANAYLDGLAQHRRLAGLPATSVNWGYWAGAGMVVRLEAEHGRRIQPDGIVGMGPEDAMPALRELLDRDAVQATVVAADWQRWAAAEPGMARNPLLRAMLGKTWARASATAPTTAPVTAPTTGPVTAPTTAPVTERAAEPAAESTPARAQNGSAPAPVEDLSRLLADAVSSVLGMPTQELDLSAPLNHLGFDSLMAGQVRAKVKDATGVQLPITRMLSGKSVTELASGLGEQLASPDGGSK